MSFKIPHKNERSFDIQGQWDSGDLDALLQSLGGNVGVISGCQASSSTGLNSSVAAGYVKLSNGLMGTIAQGTVLHDAADVTNPRFDLVVIDSTGAKAIRKGTPTATNAPYPLLTAGDVLLAAAYIPANTTTLVADMYVDKRVEVNEFWIEKTANQSVTSSTAFVNDDHIIFPVGVDEEWWFEMWLYYDGPNFESLAGKWSLPANCTLEWGGHRFTIGGGGSSVIGRMDLTWDLTGTSTLNFGTAVLSGVTGVTEMGSARVHGKVVSGDTAGDVIFQWAPSASDAEPLVVRTGTHMRLWRLA